MKRRKWTYRITFAALAAAGVALLWALTPEEARFKQPSNWQQFASPGSLSSAHRFLEDHCAACHTPVRGVQRINCVACHANEEALLQRQPTSFHATISSCRECHPEHRSVDRRPTDMSHVTLARIGLDQLKDDGESGTENQLARAQLLAWLRSGPASNHPLTPHPKLAPEEAILGCSSCHANEDRHLGLFGRDCAPCHTSDKWTIPEFRHPSPASMDCAQCHQAPPSHYMQHFQMISAKVAGKPHAGVNQCFECHRTTSWNDIRGVGWYKHH